MTGDRAIASGETLAAEFQRRHIDAYLSRGSAETTCHAEINNVEVQVHFRTDQVHGDISWQGNDGQTHHNSHDIEPSNLADAIIDSLVNPA